MTSPALHRLKQICNQLVELPREQQLAFLDARADIGEETRRQLQELLHVDAELAASTTRRAKRFPARIATSSSIATSSKALAAANPAAVDGGTRETIAELMPRIEQLRGD